MTVEHVHVKIAREIAGPRSIVIASHNTLTNAHEAVPFLNTFDYTGVINVI
jgi:hypothetical protein